MPSVFSTANSSSQNLAYVLSKMNSLEYANPTHLNPDACNKGEAFQGNILKGGEPLALIDPQNSPRFVCIRCGKISILYDTITKLHKPLYLQKHGPPSQPRKNNKLFVVICLNINFMETVKIIGMMHLKVMKKEYG